MSLTSIVVVRPERLSNQWALLVHGQLWSAKRKTSLEYCVRLRVKSKELRSLANPPISILPSSTLHSPPPFPSSISLESPNQNSRQVTLTKSTSHFSTPSKIPQSSVNRNG
ncbi:hypothetical protein ElyMa_001559800 [Elysia marginata]|uniref:Uncharacterized protein n=1 Tax=Elysia marginata TaxID=1093978 RepID=A0AAV4JEC0_9GAST|nr:hypothetical protein ElyMa_001559800 [Elysia marginata]